MGRTKKAEVKFTPTMQMVDMLLRDKHGTDLRTFITDIRAGRAPAKKGEDGWDDVAYWVRNYTGFRATRETARNWARRFGIPLERPHNYGVNADDMPDGDQEPAAV